MSRRDPGLGRLAQASTTRRFAGAGLALGLALTMFAGAARAAGLERFLILDADGGKAGEILIQDRGPKVDIAWSWKNNGRGSETQEELEFDPAGLPTSWRIRTKTDLGGSEASQAGLGVTTFRRVGDTLTWSVGGVEGGRTQTGPGLFMPQAASPWALSVHARALLALPSHTLPGVPDGGATLNALPDEVIEGVRLKVYELNRAGRPADVLRFDDAGALVAIGDGLVVRAGREALGVALRRAAVEREEAAQQALQRTLLHRFDTPVRVRNVRVFDPISGTLGSPSSVVFFQDRITGVEPLARPDEPGETVIDGAGGTLIPGLHDTHYHASLGRAEGAWLSLAAGVTTARDMGSNNEFLEHFQGEIA
ncbi:MAG TPA: hypothetical protein VF495_28500, partial [Phenylobacterium sp.]